MKPSTIAVICLIFITACGKSGGGSGGAAQPLGWPTLISPQNNTACFTGVNVDSNHASVTFSWQAATNAATYNLVVTNLNNAKQTTYPVTGTSEDVVLTKAEPYSWYVMARSGGMADSTSSPTWKFYVAGNPTTTYAPFPATIIAPANNAVVPSTGGPQVTVVFQWSGADIDNDIAFYTIYLDNTNATTKVIPSITSDSTTMSLAPMKTYYWRVVTTDSEGNTSDSGIYTFII